MMKPASAGAEGPNWRDRIVETGPASAGGALVRATGVAVRDVLRQLAGGASPGGEAEAVARLQHPHVVQIYEVGEHDGRFFLALEHVAGGNLASRLGAEPWPAEEAAGLVETLAEAVQAAHERGVVHRDLKPENVL